MCVVFIFLYEKKVLTFMGMPELKNLRASRTALSMSQQELAKRAKVSQSMIAKIEAGRLDPTLSNARRIAEALEEEKPKGFISKIKDWMK